MFFVRYIIFTQIAVGWWFIKFLLTRERGPKEPRRVLQLAGILGSLGVIVALVLERWLLSPKLNLDNFHRSVNPLGTTTLLVNCLLIGVIEELAKALPLTAVIYRKKYFDELTDGIIYFGIAGMVFGVLEDIGYTLSLGVGAGIGKIITGPFIHAGFSVLIGWTIAQRKVLKKPLWTVVAGFALAVVLHAMYDFGLFYHRAWSLISSLAITVSVNIAIFVLYRRAIRGDEKLGLSVVGANLYCRSCGWPNPRHFVYCVSCGQKS